jgi:dTDP-4-dehydrorhamnose reductase
VTRGLPHQAPSRLELDVADPLALAAALDRHRPWAVVNALGFGRPEAVATDPEASRRGNVLAASVMAAACARAGIQLLAWSSHLVFDGSQRQPYLEGDAPAPRGPYATSKLESERVVLAACPQALLIRVGPLFAPWDQASIAARAIHAVRTGGHFEAAADVTISPSYLPHLIAVALDLLIDGEHGVWHLANQGAVTYADFARAALRGASLPADRVRSISAAEIPWLAPRPRYSALGSSRGVLMPALDQALAHYREACQG